MSEIGKHKNLPPIVEMPKKQYHQQLEAQLVIFSKSLVPEFSKTMLRNILHMLRHLKPSESNPKMDLSDNGQCSTTEQQSDTIQRTPQPQIYLAWSPMDDATPLAKLIDRSEDLPECGHFAINTSYLFLFFKKEDLYLQKILPKVFHVTDIHILLSKLSTYKTSNLALEYPNVRDYTKYQIKEIWYHLKSEETTRKLAEFQSLQISASVDRKPKDQLYWLFITYQWLYWLALSYCFVEILNTTTVEKVMKLCCKMQQELRERETNFLYCKVSTDDYASNLCSTWKQTNLEFQTSEFYDTIMKKSIHVMRKWKHNIPEWVQTMLTNKD